MNHKVPSGTKPSSGTGQQLYRRARTRIPGGTQLLGKRPEQYLPGGWPAYYRRAQGCTIWDMDDRPYADFTSNGIGTCLLGYADPVVNAAVADCISRGSMCTLNCPAEVELAERLCAIHPWAEKVRYARTGGEAMAISVRIARAFTRRGIVAFCGYHGWSDWYLAANLGESDALSGHLLSGLDPGGVPRALRGSSLPFRYNQIAELEKIVAAHRSELAAIVMEPRRYDAPQDGFLEKIRALADETGAVLVFDEITAGWRSNHGGIHLTLGVAPDLAVFAKALSNGFPMAAIIGRGDVMDAAQQTFVSSTYWTEAIGPTAAVATLARLAALNVSRHVVDIGVLVRTGWTAAGARHGLPVKVGGIPALCILGFDTGENSRAVMTLFTQEMLARGFLSAGGFYPTFAHRPDLVVKYLQAVGEVFGLLKKHLDRGTVATALHGPVAQSGFARLT
ncbi:MAG: aminotransferase class III-fold pyridoxal phosphate-dependent enzyme [Lacunisphaera sp.]|nr:aminotransferase class III-fold pyridoxal phosphate-dependent enzyme [Lacunisphaera sp.]